MKVYSQIEVTLSKDNEISYVRYSDHMKEVHELRRGLSRWQDRARERANRIIELRREVERLRDVARKMGGVCEKHEAAATNEIDKAGWGFWKDELRDALNSQRIFDSSQEVQGECGMCSGDGEITGLRKWSVLHQQLEVTIICPKCHGSGKHIPTTKQGEG
jgi:hypothetical protein